MLPASVQITELIWVLSGIPGWIVWLFNGIYAMKVYGAARKSGDSYDRMWTGTTLYLTIASLVVSSSGISLGLFGMSEKPVVQTITRVGWAVTAHLLIVSIAVLSVGLAWNKMVNMLRESMRQQRANPT